MNFYYSIVNYYIKIYKYDISSINIELFKKWNVIPLISILYICSKLYYLLVFYYIIIFSLKEKFQTQEGLHDISRMNLNYK